MKSSIFLIILSFACGTLVYCQCPPSVLKIQTPACEAPKDLAVKRINCDSLIVKWQGNANQSYIIKTYSMDSLRNQPIVNEINKYQCSSNGTCTASIPVKQGTTINWSVQSICNINNTVFYSPTTEGKEANIPYCNAIASRSTMQSTTNTNTQLIVYPNPSQGYLNVDYNSKQNGIAVISVSDVAGKTVFNQAYDVVQNINHYQLNLHNLSPGVYLLSLKNGEEISYAKFSVLKK